MIKKVKLITPLIFTLMIILLFHYTKLFAFKIYPVIANTFIFFVFFLSLFTKQTIIQKFVTLMEGKDLDEKSLIYTRNLTYIWVCFTFINLLISIYTLFSPEKFWILYNGFISYILIGLIFAIEYPIRIIFKRKNNL